MVDSNTGRIRAFTGTDQIVMVLNTNTDTGRVERVQLNVGRMQFSTNLFLIFICLQVCASIGRIYTNPNTADIESKKPTFDKAVGDRKTK